MAKINYLVNTQQHFDYEVRNKGEKPYWKPNDYERYVGVERGGKALRPYFSTPIGGLVTEYPRHIIDDAIKGSNLRNITSNRALAKLDDELTIISSLFESWYERREAYKMLTGAIKGVVEFATNWKNPRYWKKLKTGVKQPTALPEAWLAYGFGLMPLVGLIDDCMKGLASPLETYTFKGTATVEYDVDSWQNTNNNQPGSKCYVHVKHLISYGCHIKPNVNPNLALMNATGLNQPFSSAWSVAPWGWAVDYFTNVSEMLSNVEHKHPGVTMLDNYMTTYDVVSWHGHLGPAKNPFSRIHGDGFRVKRTVLNKPPSYRLVRTFPLLGTNQAAYLSSALAVTMKGKA